MCADWGLKGTDMKAERISLILSGCSLLISFLAIAICTGFFDPAWLDQFRPAGHRRPVVMRSARGTAVWADSLEESDAALKRSLQK